MELSSLKIEWDKGYLAGTNYQTVKCPNHPKAWSNGYIYLHRLVAELKIGRFLTDEEIVHHINENPLDNRPENLEVTCRVDHVNHHRKAKIVCLFECPECYTQVERERRQLHKGNKLVFCSHSCRGKYYTKPR